MHNTFGPTRKYCGRKSLHWIQKEQWTHRPDTNLSNVKPKLVGVEETSSTQSVLFLRILLVELDFKSLLHMNQTL